MTVRRLVVIENGQEIGFVPMDGAELHEIKPLMDVLKGEYPTAIIKCQHESGIPKKSRKPESGVI